MFLKVSDLQERRITMIRMITMTPTITGTMISTSKLLDFVLQPVSSIVKMAFKVERVGLEVEALLPVPTPTLRQLCDGTTLASSVGPDTTLLDSMIG